MEPTKKKERKRDCETVTTGSPIGGTNSCHEERARFTDSYGTTALVQSLTT